MPTLTIANHISISYTVSSDNTSTTVKIDNVSDLGNGASNDSSNRTISLKIGSTTIHTVTADLIASGSGSGGSSSSMTQSDAKKAAHSLFINGLTTKISNGTAKATFSRNASAYNIQITLLHFSASASATISIPVKPSWAVTYYANGGSGAPAKQTKWYNTNLVLSTVKPTRVNYRFLGWATSNTATSANSSYDPGDTYTGNAALNLYAVWAPIISLNVTAIRCDESGVEDDEGTHISVSATWSSPVSATLTMVVSPSGPSGSLSTTSGASGTATALLSGANESTTYTIRITASTAASSTAGSNLAAASITKSATASAAIFPLDFHHGGRGAGIMAAAPVDGLRMMGGSALIDWNGVYIGLGMAGMIQMFAGTAAPAGWLMCNGAAVSRTDYATLFAAIGTTWGAGNGSTTFNLPDLRGRAPIGAGTGSGLSARTLGSKGGTQDAVVPYHRHSVAKVSSAITGGGHTHPLTYNTDAASGTAKARVVPNGSGDTTSNNGARSNTHTHDLPAHNTDYVGTSGNTTGANMQPFAVVNFIICTGKTS